MSPHSAHRAYRQAFHTVGKTRQVVMLYDGAIRFLKQAKEAMEQNRIQDRYNLLTRVSDIVLGLQGCLDFEKGDSVAKTLYDFYSSVDARILTLYRNNDTALCQNLIEELKEMRGIWDSIDKGTAAETEAAQVAPPAAAPAPVRHKKTEAPAAELGKTPRAKPSLPLSSDITA